MRERREAIAAERRARAEAAELRDKAAAERIELANEEALDAAERAHGELGKKIAAVHTDHGVVIVKRAHPAIFKRFMDQGKTDTKTLDALVRGCLVYPSVTVYEEIVEAQPFNLSRFADAITVLAGLRKEEISAKS
jgi:hypothetical protein